jgi:hypothetical protein
MRRSHQLFADPCNPADWTALSIPKVDSPAKGPAMGNNRAKKNVDAGATPPNIPALNQAEMNRFALRGDASPRPAPASVVDRGVPPTREPECVLPNNSGAYLRR